MIFRVKLQLKLTQRISEKEWRVTVAGVEKVHTDQWVIYYAESMEVALKSFNPQEVLSVLITTESYVPESN